MKRTLSIMTIGLLAATSMAFASGETLDQSDSTMLFGEKSTIVTTLNQDEMKVTEGKYWYPYYGYGYTNYDYDYSNYDMNSITEVFSIGTTTAANQVNVLGGMVPVVSTNANATATINGGTTTISD